MIIVYFSSNYFLGPLGVILSCFLSGIFWPCFLVITHLLSGIGNNKFLGRRSYCNKILEYTFQLLITPIDKFHRHESVGKLWLMAMMLCILLLVQFIFYRLFLPFINSFLLMSLVLPNSPQSVMMIYKPDSVMVLKNFEPSVNDRQQSNLSIIETQSEVMKNNNQYKMINTDRRYQIVDDKYNQLDLKPSLDYNSNSIMNNVTINSANKIYHQLDITCQVSCNNLYTFLHTIQHTFLHVTLHTLIIFIRLLNIAIIIILNTIFSYIHLVVYWCQHIVILSDSIRIVNIYQTALNNICFFILDTLFFISSFTLTYKKQEYNITDIISYSFLLAFYRSSMKFSGRIEREFHWLIDKLNYKYQRAVKRHTCVLLKNISIDNNLLRIIGDYL